MHSLLQAIVESSFSLSMHILMKFGYAIGEVDTLNEDSSDHTAAAWHKPDTQPRAKSSHTPTATGGDGGDKLRKTKSAFWAFPTKSLAWI